MHAIFTDYLAVTEIDCSRQTTKVYRNSYKIFQNYLDAKGIEFARITQQEVQGFIREAGESYKTSTLKTHVKAVRAAFNYARNCTLTVQRFDDPFTRLRYPKDVQKEPVTFSDAEIQQLFEAIQTDREWICFHLFAYAGLRRAEVCGLRWEDVDFENRQLRILGKGNKLRKVPMHPKLSEALAPLRSEGFVVPTLSHFNGIKEPGTQLDPDSLSRSNDIWFRRAGLDKAHNHCFRRTMNSVLKEKGVAKDDRERIMGWAPADVEGRHYARFLDADLHKAVCKVSYRL